ncbi:MAG: type I-A CRISPR-associated protein Cas5 [Nitrososphaeria archaeon]|nr:type I-A CRISPR-associated protein Cas5 [Nitrososphaeria archaeon]
MPIGYIFDIEFAWGFQSKIVGLSKTSPSFYYPPPTTILGAIAESAAKEHNIGEFKGKEIITKLSENLLAIGIRPINCIPIKYEDLNRIISLKVTGGELYPDPKRLKGSFDSPAIGKTIFSVFDNNPPTLRLFLVFKNNSIFVNNTQIKLNEDIFWKIHRIGSKESIVSTISVKELLDLEIIKGEIDTNYSFPRLGVKLINEIYKRWDVENYVDPFKIKLYVPVKDYGFGENFVEYMIPIRISYLTDPKYCVGLEKGCVCYKFEEEKVIGCG